MPGCRITMSHRKFVNHVRVMGGVDNEVKSVSVLLVGYSLLFATLLLLFFVILLVVYVRGPFPFINESWSLIVAQII